MPEFRYTAQAIDGSIRHGVVSADNRQGLTQALRQQGLTVTEASRMPLVTSGRWRDRLERVPEVAKVFFTENIRVMLHAGLPIGRALGTLAEQVTHRYFRRVIESIRLDVEGGVALSTALAKYPRVFSELYVAMIAAGEASGKLDNVLDRLARQLKKTHTLRAKVRNAMIYPTIVVLGMLAVATIMLVVVIPQISEIFRETGAALPLPTRILLGTSQFFLQRWWFVILAGVAIVSLTTTLNRSLAGRRAFHRALLRFPIIGRIIVQVNLASFTRSLSSLLATDIPIVQTFQIISRTVGNLPYRQALTESADSLRSGSTVVKVLRRYPRLFPPMITQMIAVGEESGTLETVTGEMATFYEEEIDQTMANLSTVIEPLIILLLGLGVAGLAVAVILPIYSLSSQIF